jgi:hypothetical protein
MYFCLPNQTTCLAHCTFHNFTILITLDALHQSPSSPLYDMNIKYHQQITLSTHKQCAWLHIIKETVAFETSVLLSVDIPAVVLRTYYCSQSSSLAVISYQKQPYSMELITQFSQASYYFLPKSCPTTHHEGTWGERRYSSFSFSSLALDWGEWSALRPGHALAPGKGSPVPIVQKAG